MTKIIFTGGTYIKPTDNTPLHYSEVHKLWYVGGYRWIKTKKKWSTVALLHSFENYELVDEKLIKATS